jgi:Lipocalin-like domain
VRSIQEIPVGSIVVTTAEHRLGGMSDPERAALHKSMLAYSGRYHVDGGDLFVRVDVSWNEAWNGTEQRRHFRIEGDKLFIESAPGPSILYPGKTEFRRIFSDHTDAQAIRVYLEKNQFHPTER